MKSTHILAASIAALCVAQTASADITVRITGSSAFRAATTNAIKNVLSGGSPAIAYAGGGSFSGATWSTFVGTLTGVTGTVTVKCNWTGSVAGIRDVTSSASIRFLADGVTATTGAGTSVAVPVTTAEGVPDIALADNAQSSTTFLTPTLNGNTTPLVGIVPFAFVKSRDTTAAITNLTRQAFNWLFSNNYAPARLFTGGTDTQPIFALGRDPFSGTRLTALAETGYGTQNPVVQSLPTISSGAITNIALYPTSTNTNIVGNDGEGSGGSLADYMRLTSASVTDAGGNVTSGSAGFITYLGEADAYRAVYGVGSSVGANGAMFLAYEGVSAFAGKTLASQTVAIASGSPTITLATPLTSLTDVVVGQIVSGTGIAPGSTILSINSLTSITLDKNATADNAAQTGIQIGSLLPRVLRNGAYPFWNYEQMLWKSGTPLTTNNIVGTSGDKFTVAVAVRNNIRTVAYGFSGLADDAAFTVQRTSDGGPISPK
jgi:hypothetical protein